MYQISCFYHEMSDCCTNLPNYIILVCVLYRDITGGLHSGRGSWRNRVWLVPVCHNHVCWSYVGKEIAWFTLFNILRGNLSLIMRLCKYKAHYWATYITRWLLLFVIVCLLFGLGISLLLILLMNLSGKEEQMWPIGQV